MLARRQPTWSRARSPRRSARHVRGATTRGQPVPSFLPGSPSDEWTCARRALDQKTWLSELGRFSQVWVLSSLAALLSMMLMLVTAQLGVPTAPPSQQALASGATQTQVCVSTAVDVKTQTCNNECNSAWHSCPTACFCLAASNRSAQRGVNSAWRSMESEDLEQLSHRLQRKWDTVPEDADAKQDAAFRDAADAALREAMEARKLEDLLDAIHENNGHASPEVLDEARALRDELKEEKHAPTAEKVDPVDPAPCQEWCVKQSIQWPGRHAREQFCAKPDCTGCEFCSQSKEDKAEVKTEDGSAPAANSPLPAQPAWKSQISAAQPARLLDEEIVGFCVPPSC